MRQLLKTISEIPLPLVILFYYRQADRLRKVFPPLYHLRRMLQIFSFTILQPPRIVSTYYCSVNHVVIFNRRWMETSFMEKLQTKIDLHNTYCIT